MALGAFSVGEYQATYNGVATGMVTSGGHNLRFRPAIKRINNTSTYGDTLIDGIYRGWSQVQLLTTFKEWNAAVRSAIWPFSNFAAPAFDGLLGTIGKLTSDAAKALVLTPVVGTPAATLGPLTFTAAKCILSDQNDIGILLGPDERDIPVLFDLLLYDDAGVKRFFAVT